MLKEFVEKIVSLKENKIYTVGSDTYSDNPLVRIEKHVDRPNVLSLSSLESVVKFIKKEQPIIKRRVFVHVYDYDNVRVFTTYDDVFGRDNIYNVVSDVQNNVTGWKDYENAIISLKSQFVQNEGTEYMLNILSRITDENSVSSEDNGITQTVEARKGISLSGKETIKSRVALMPYRTFLEVEQPKSEFIVRLREGGQIGLFEADGGMWKLEAKKNIKEFLEKELVHETAVVVTA